MADGTDRADMPDATTEAVEVPEAVAEEGHAGGRRRAKPGMGRKAAIGGVVAVAVAAAVGTGAFVLSQGGREEPAAGKKADTTKAKEEEVDAPEASQPAAADATADAGQPAAEETAPEPASETLWPVAVSHYETDPGGTLKVYDWQGVTDIVLCGHATFGLTGDGAIVVSQDAHNHDCYGLPDTSSWRGVTEIDGSDHLLAGLREDGTVVAAGFPHNEWANEATSDWQDIRGISADDYIVGLRKDGTVALAGQDAGDTSLRYREEDGTYVAPILPDVSEWHGIQQVETSGRFVAGLTEDGNVLVADGPHGTVMVDELRGATKIACTTTKIAALMPDGTVAAAWLEKPAGAVASAPVDDTPAGFDDAAEWSGMVDIDGGGGQFVGVRGDGTVACTEWRLSAEGWRQNAGSDNKGVESHSVDGWRGIRKAFAGAECIAALCDDEGTAAAIREAWEGRQAEIEAEQADDPEKRSEEIEWYDSKYLSDGRWHGWWYSFVAPDGYEVSNGIKSKGASLSLPSDPNRLVPVGTDEGLFDYRYDIPVIAFGENGTSESRYINGLARFDLDGETEREPYASATGVTWRVLAAHTPGGRPYLRYEVVREVGDKTMRASVACVDVDEDTMRQLIDSVVIDEKNFAVFAPMA